MNTMKTLKFARLALAGAIIGGAVVNIIAHSLGYDGSHHAIGAVAGGVLTAAAIKVAHIV